MICEKCGTTIPEGSTVCPNCEAPVDSLFQAPEAPSKKSHLGLFLGLGTVAVLAIAAIVVGLMTDWFGLNGPIAQMRRAAQNAGELRSCSMQLAIDIEALGLKLDDINLTVQVDPDKKELNFLAEANYMDTNLVIAAHDGTAYLGSDGEFTATDISEQLDEFWQSYDKSTEGDKPLDLIDLVKELDSENEIAEYVDLDTLRTCIQTLFKHMNNSSWAAENFGYSKSNLGGLTHYRFDIPLTRALNAILTDLEPAFKNPDDFKSAVEELESATDLNSVDLSVDYGVANDRLTSCYLDCRLDSVSVALKVTDINTAEVDMARLDEIAKSAE